jgi:hypothetical protein
MLKRSQIMGSGVQAALPSEGVHIRIIRQAIFESSKESAEGSVSLRRLWRSVYLSSVRNKFGFWTRNLGWRGCQS